MAPAAGIDWRYFSWVDWDCHWIDRGNCWICWDCGWIRWRVWIDPLERLQDLLGLLLGRPGLMLDQMELLLGQLELLDRLELLLG